MKENILLILLFFSGLAWSQDAKTILTKVNSTYSGRNVSYETRYELFKGHKSTKVHSSYLGKVISSNGNVYQKIDKTEFVYTKDFSVKINAAEKALVVLPGQENVQPELDLDIALRECATSKVIDKGDFYRLVFRMKAANSLQCSVIKLEIDKVTYTLNQIDVYYSFFQDFSSDFSQKDLEQPHMRIIFSNVNLDASTKDELFLQSTYFSTGNGSLKPLGNYATYNLYDNR